MDYKYVICINNENYKASLEKGKVYPTIDDKEADERDFIRVVDESGEDYLFPKDYFVHIELPQVVREALSQNE